MSRGYRVALVGATGAVGREMLRILGERSFPIASLRLLASARSAGRRLTFAGEEIEVAEATPGSFEDLDLAVFDTPDEVALDLVPEAARRCVVVDKSTAFRMRDDVPLVVPEVNPEAARAHHGIVANPNCTMVTMLMPLAPLHRTAGCRRVVASSYQSVSGAGGPGVEDLYEQLEKLIPERDAVRRGSVEGLVGPGRAFRHPIAFNAIPHVGGFDDTGRTSEERRFAQETCKILDAAIDIFATCVRVPTVVGHAISAWVEFERPLGVEEARAAIAAAPGVALEDDPAAARYPTPLLAAGEDKAFVGRIRRDPANERALGFFSACDNLRKGAALNAVQVAELLVAEGLV
ncbi:MAG: aspartate-semialdehyde dehydrogenase [Acidobacteria bacterium]|nr:aspartate-semialdehyde dehydrogenase [Acidobacteriota bacterium]